MVAQALACVLCHSRLSGIQPFDKLRVTSLSW
jgi:hypothetical protein